MQLDSGNMSEWLALNWLLSLPAGSLDSMSAIFLNLDKFTETEKWVDFHHTFNEIP